MRRPLCRVALPLRSTAQRIPGLRYPSAESAVTEPAVPPTPPPPPKARSHAAAQRGSTTAPKACSSQDSGEQEWPATPPAPPGASRSREDARRTGSQSSHQPSGFTDAAFKWWLKEIKRGNTLVIMAPGILLWGSYFAYWLSQPGVEEAPAQLRPDDAPQGDAVSQVSEAAAFQETLGVEESPDDEKQQTAVAWGSSGVGFWTEQVPLASVGESEPASPPSNSGVAAS
eukprot:TRINITY_DN114068_c0_g1_i1.p1 TRINITY_DN114068_c0_g1~~TRINITY_DN114068_c0_g1_i1.p1  ORF type:complete len:228 (-),score=30.04 TRINITY_DN114068_c0_g1_i1:71-754(-)